MTQRIIASRTNCIILVLIAVLFATASVAAYPRDIRYNGVTLSSMTVDTGEISKSLPSTYGKISDHILLMGIEGVAGDLNGWAVGGFGYKGSLTSKEGTSMAQFSVVMAGVTVETLVLQQDTREFMAGVRVGGGNYSLRLEPTSEEVGINSIADAAVTPTSTTLESPVWYLEPSIGMRTKLGDLLALEGRVGYGISMSNGEWSYSGKSIDTVNVTIGGWIVNVGIKVVSF